MWASLFAWAFMLFFQLVKGFVVCTPPVCSSDQPDVLHKIHHHNNQHPVLAIESLFPLFVVLYDATTCMICDQLWENHPLTKNFKIGVFSMDRRGISWGAQPSKNNVHRGEVIHCCLHMRAPDKLLCLQWVKKASDAVTSEVIINSSKVCCVSVATDCLEDEIVHCIKPGGVATDATARISTEVATLRDWCGQWSLCKRWKALAQRNYCRQWAVTVCNPRRMREGYSSLSVYLSAMALAATYLICKSKVRCYKVPYGISNLCILLKTLCSPLLASLKPLPSTLSEKFLMDRTNNTGVFSRYISDSSCKLTDSPL